MNEYINKLNLHRKMVKAGEIKEDSDFLELMRDQIYYKLNGNKK